MTDITDLIERAREGDRTAFATLFALLYDDLRRLAHARLRQSARDTLVGTTMLVHECFLRFANAKRLSIQSRAHFFAYAAKAMRSIIVDAARASGADKRGSDAEHVELGSEHAAVPSPGDTEILDVEAALKELEQLDPRLAQVVEMRYFGGMRDAEIGAVLGVTERTVRRDWEKARMVLALALKGP
jgi:RNA polymerase sigma factor (TIGR02999 family)